MSDSAATKAPVTEENGFAVSIAVHEGSIVARGRRLPNEPTRLRAAVWRRLRNLGAVYLQNSAAAPRTPQGERALRALRSEIVESMSGQAFLVSTGRDRRAGPAAAPRRHDGGIFPAMMSGRVQQRRCVIVLVLPPAASADLPRVVDMIVFSPEMVNDLS
ncbi:Chromate resistance protein ChrB [Nonomuraea sp. NPDC050451]|uniref:Chromate resistance protein ChrB n=1 Tax=Nonomuraea sp. NPDC050451 TaxID=3364364 RepID=UPI0037B2A354